MTWKERSGHTSGSWIGVGFVGIQSVDGTLLLLKEATVSGGKGLW